MGKSAQHKIAIRHLHCTPGPNGLADGFTIRHIETLLQGNDTTQPVHRHTFFYVLVLEKSAWMNHEASNYGRSVLVNPVT